MNACIPLIRFHTSCCNCWNSTMPTIGWAFLSMIGYYIINTLTRHDQAPNRYCMSLYHYWSRYMCHSLRCRRYDFLSVGHHHHQCIEQIRQLISCTTIKVMTLDDTKPLKHMSLDRTLCCSFRKDLFINADQYLQMNIHQMHLNVTIPHADHDTGTPLLQLWESVLAPAHVAPQSPRHCRERVAVPLPHDVEQSPMYTCEDRWS